MKEGMLLLSTAFLHSYSVCESINFHFTPSRCVLFSATFELLRVIENWDFEMSSCLGLK